MSFTQRQAAAALACAALANGLDEWRPPPTPD